MKKSLFAVVLAAALPSAFAADQTVTGIISDSMCNTASPGGRFHILPS